MKRRAATAWRVKMPAKMSRMTSATRLGGAGGVVWGGARSWSRTRTEPRCLLSLLCLLCPGLGCVGGG